MLRCRIGIGPLSDSGRFQSYEIEGPVDESRLPEVLDLIDRSLAPAPDHVISSALSRLSLMVRPREMAVADVKVQQAIYAEALQAYPGDIVLAVLRDWRGHFFPDFEELRTAIEERSTRRLALRFAVQTTREHAQRERADRAAEEAARERARREWLLKHPGESLVPEEIAARRSRGKPIPSDEYKPRPAAEIAAELDRFRMRMSQETPEELKWLRQMEDLDVVDSGCAP